MQSLATAAAEPHFDVLGPAHVGALAAIGAGCALFALLTRRPTMDGQDDGRRMRLTCYALAAILVLAQVAGDISEIAHGRYSLQESLPLHMCDLAAFAGALTLVLAARGPMADPLGRWHPLFELTYFWSLGGTTQALMTPVIDETFPHPRFILFFLTHGANLWAVAALMFGLGLRPRRGFVRRGFLLTNIFVVFDMGMNRLLGANYMFLCGPPENPSLYDYLGPWPLSVVALETLAFVVLVILWLPFARGSRLSAA